MRIFRRYGFQMHQISTTAAVDEPHIDIQDICPNQNLGNTQSHRNLPRSHGSLLSTQHGLFLLRTMFSETSLSGGAQCIDLGELCDKFS